MPFLVAAGAAIISGATAIAGAVGTALGAGALGAAVANGIMAAGYGLAALTGASGFGAALGAWSTVALATTALTPPPVGRGPAGTQVDFQADTNAGIPFVVGRTGTAGKIVHVNTSGQAHKNGHIYYLVALSAGPIEGTEGFKANDLDIAFAGDTAQTGKYLNAMWVRTSPGTKPDGPVQPGGIPPAWITDLTPAHRFSGIAMAAWTMFFMAEAYPTGTPQPMWVVRGPAVYDPRKDSTYPGGVGPQRPYDETTWSFAGRENPFLQALTFCLGRRSNGKLTFGLGAPIEAIDVAAFAYGASVCEANGWTIGGEITSADRKRDVLRVMLQAGGGQPVPLGGKLSCTVRAPRVSLATITGDDVVGEPSIPGTKGRRDRINQGIPRYRSEAHRWEMVSAAPVRVDAYVAQDGGLRSREMTYQLVQDARQAAQLCAYDLVDAREFEPVVLPLKPKFSGYKPGDCVTVNEPELLLINQKMIITRRDRDLVSGIVTLTLRSETSEKHDFALGRTASPPPTPGLGTLDPSIVSSPNLGSWAATGGVLESADGSTVPAIIVTGAVDDPNVSNVLVDYRLVLDEAHGVFGEWVMTEHPSKVRRIELRALISKAKYHVQVRYRTVKNVEGQLALDLGYVQAGELKVSGIATIGGKTPAQVIAELEAVTATGQALTKSLLEAWLRLQEERSELFKEVFHNGLRVKTIVLDEVQQRTEGQALILSKINLLGAVTPEGDAFVLNEMTVKVGPGQTFAQYRAAVQASFQATQALVVAESQARADADTALAQSVTTVSTTVNGHTASITNMQTSLNGVSAQWVLSVSAGRVGGIKLAANPTVSSLVMMADQIGFSNGVGNLYPLAVVGSEVHATNFRVDKVFANAIETDSIKANNIVETVTGADNSAVTLNNGSPTTIVSIVPYVVKGKVTIRSFVNIGNAGGISTAQVQILRDGSQIDSYVQFCDGAWGDNFASFEIDDHPSAGYHTYSIVVTRNSSGGGPLIKSRARITAELRKTEV